MARVYKTFLFCVATFSFYVWDFRIIDPLREIIFFRFSQHTIKFQYDVLLKFHQWKRNK